MHLEKQKRVEELTKLEASFVAEKSSMVKEGMQEIEKLVTDRYDEVLKQYKEHYASRIRDLEAQVAAITQGDI